MTLSIPKRNIPQRWHLFAFESKCKSCAPYKPVSPFEKISCGNPNTVWLLLCKSICWAMCRHSRLADAQQLAQNNCWAYRNPGQVHRRGGFRRTMPPNSFVHCCSIREQVIGSSLYNCPIVSAQQIQHFQEAPSCYCTHGCCMCEGGQVNRKERWWNTA